MAADIADVIASLQWYAYHPLPVACGMRMGIIQLGLALQGECTVADAWLHCWAHKTDEGACLQLLPAAAGCTRSRAFTGHCWPLLEGPPVLDHRTAFVSFSGSACFLAQVLDAESRIFLYTGFLSPGL